MIVYKTGDVLASQEKRIAHGCKIGGCGDRTMRWIILTLLLSGCTTINIRTVDYCHNQDGSVNKDDPRCKQAAPVILNGDVHDNFDQPKQ